MIWNSARSWVSIVLVGIGIFIAGVGHSTAQTPAPATPEPGVVREVLSSGNPAAAPVQALELVRYTIPPGTTLPAHTHPGMQVATIVSGTLHYTVVEGEVPLYRMAPSDGTSGAPGAITPEDGEVMILPGDSFAEPEGVVHFGRNLGPEPVVILVASLFVAGEPPAILVTPVATPEP